MKFSLEWPPQRWAAALPRRQWIAAAVVCMLVLPSFLGCSRISNYVDNHFKVGPNYREPIASVSEQWIDYQTPSVRNDTEALDAWWQVYRDPVLNQLIQTAHNQNLGVKEASWRILQSQSQYNYFVGRLYPQLQDLAGASTVNEQSQNLNYFPNLGRYHSRVEVGAQVAWELDFWGLYRRAVEAASATLEASVEDYRNVLVLLQAEIASTYVQIRTCDQQLVYLQRNLDFQKGSLQIATSRFRDGITTEIDVTQATSLVGETASRIPPVKIQRRLATNRLCHLLGMPPHNIEDLLEGPGPIPTAPTEVAIGIPLQLLRRRPDVRRAERAVAAQSEQVGIATAELFPHISLTGTFALGTRDIMTLFEQKSTTGQFGPTFRWNILNYGRLLNQVKIQDAITQQLSYHYMDVVLQANQEVEDGLITFMESQDQVKALTVSTEASQRSAELAVSQYREGIADYNRVFVIQRQLAEQQNSLAIAKSLVPQGLIHVFKALGGGWKAAIEEVNPPSQPPSLPPSP